MPAHIYTHIIQNFNDMAYAIIRLHLFQNWLNHMAQLPIDIVTKNGQWMVEWLDIFPHEIVDPFFKHTVNKLVESGRTPFLTLLCDLPLENNQISKDSLSPIEIKKSKATPNIIFHLSRCGSTLAAQMFSQANEITVISEPRVINKILATSSFNGAERREYLEKIMNIFINHITTKYVIFKLTSWNLYSFDLFNKIYPQLKSVFIYRAPTEVIESHLRHPAGWLKSCKSENKHELIKECAHHIAKMMKFAVNAQSQSLLCINHIDFPDAINHMITPHFHIHDLTRNEIDAINHRALFYSKNKNEKFQEKLLSDPNLIELINETHNTYTLDTFNALENKQLMTNDAEYYEEAKIFENSHVIENKVIELEKKIAQDSHNLSLYQDLNHIFRKMGDLEKARQSCLTITNTFPNNIYYSRVQRIFSGQPLSGDHTNLQSMLPGEFVQFKHYLTVEQHTSILDFVRNNKQYCKYSCNAGRVNFIKRKTLVISLKEAGSPVIDIVKHQVLKSLPEVMSRMSLPPFTATSLEMKISIHLDGFYFKAHTDDRLIPSRKMAFLYYFNFDEKAFEGGDLLLFDTSFAKKKDFSKTIFTRIRPENNSILFIPSGFYHAVTPVTLPNNDFEKGRFCISGHVRCE